MQMSAAMRQAARAVREFRAVALVGCSLTNELRSELDEHLRAIPQMKVSELKALTERVEATLSSVREALGALVPSSEFVALVDDMEQHPDEMLWMQKHVIDTQLFSNMAEVVPRWPLFPPHLRVGIDHHGHFPGGLEWRLLEASLFESAALLWNDVVDSEVDDSRSRGDDKIPGKRYRERKRSTIRATFALLEGYLNGVAYDISLTRDPATLSKGALELLTERGEQDKARFKTLREKLFGYPRIALGLDHSTVDEQNEHVKFLLENEREMRDAFVHPTPRQEPGRPELRERTYFEFSQQTVAELLDHTIGLIRYVDGILEGRFGRVEIWLRNRSADGRFTAETFH